MRVRSSFMGIVSRLKAGWQGSRVRKALPINGKGHEVHKPITRLASAKANSVPIETTRSGQVTKLKVLSKHS